jgi:hypothetical protein
VCEPIKEVIASQNIRGTKGNKWSHAQKMRAAISHHFSVTLQMGNERFFEKIDGTWSGNPSISDVVARYMRSLKRRKVSCIIYINNYIILLIISHFIV